MSKRNDISTPEGYFDALQQRLGEIPARNPRKKVSPYSASLRDNPGSPKISDFWGGSVRANAPEGETFFRGFRRLAPYAAIAASFLAIVMIGSAVLRPTAVPAEDDTWTYVSYLADALDPDGAALVDGAGWEVEEEEGLTPDDIVNYLLADGISVEHLNYLSYEEGY